MKTCMSCIDHSPCRFIHPQEGLDDQRKLILDYVQITGHGCGEEIQNHSLVSTQLHRGLCTVQQWHTHINPRQQITEFFEHHPRNIRGNLCVRKRAVWPHLQCSAAWWQYLPPSSPGSQRPCIRAAHTHEYLSHTYQHQKHFISVLNPYKQGPKGTPVRCVIMHWLILRFWAILLP